MKKKTDLVDQLLDCYSEETYNKDHRSPGEAVKLG